MFRNFLKNTFRLSENCEETEFKGMLRWYIGLWILFIPLAGYYLLIDEEQVVLGVAAVLVGIVLALFHLPWFSLCYRRLKSLGRNPKWAWAMLVVGIGTVLVLVLCLGAAVFNAAFNKPVDLYGAPHFDPVEDPTEPPVQSLEETTEKAWMSSDEERPEETKVLESLEIEPFDPSMNIQPVLYGPPWMFESYDPSENWNVDLYGPPPFEPEEEVVEEPSEAGGETE